MGNRHTRCCAFIINEANEILLIEQYSYDKRTYWWLPGGGLEENENPEDGIRREIKEELGIEINIYDVFQMKNTNTARSYKEYIVGICSIKENQNIIIGQYEMDGIINYKWFNIENEINYNAILLDRDILPFIIEAKKRPYLAHLTLPNGV